MGELQTVILLLIKGILGGFVVAVPIGAVGAICMRLALQGKSIRGLTTGLGAALADTLLAIIAIAGIQLAFTFLESNEKLFEAVGGIILLGFGVYLLLQKPDFTANKTELLENGQGNGNLWRHAKKLMRACLAGFALTIINPATFLGFIGILTALEAYTVARTSYWLAGILVAGIFAGSMLWWSTLTLVTAAVRHTLSDTVLIRIERILGIILVGGGIVSLVFSIT